MAMEKCLKPPLNASLGGGPTATIVDHGHLAMVATAELVELLELLDRETGVVAPAVATHEAALHLAVVVEGVAMEVGHRRGNHLVDKSLVAVEKTLLPSLRLGGCRTNGK